MQRKLAEGAQLNVIKVDHYLSLSGSFGIKPGLLFCLPFEARSQCVRLVLAEMEPLRQKDLCELASAMDPTGFLFFFFLLFLIIFYFFLFFKI